MSATTAPRKRPPHGDYPASLRREARELGAAGWTYWQIEGIFARRGVDPLPTANAIRWWLSGAADFERQMEHQRRNKARRAARASGGRLRGSRPRTPEFKMTRLKSLSAIGLSHRDIAAVMEFDLGDPLTENQVRHALDVDRYPKVRR